MVFLTIFADFHYFLRALLWVFSQHCYIDERVDKQDDIGWFGWTRRCRTSRRTIWWWSRWTKRRMTIKWTSPRQTDWSNVSMFSTIVANSWFKLVIFRGVTQLPTVVARRRRRSFQFMYLTLCWSLQSLDITCSWFQAFSPPTVVFSELRDH